MGQLFKNEKWVPGWEGKYSVTEDGEIFSHQRTKCIRKSRIKEGGYVCLTLTTDYKKKNLYVHRAVAMCFVGNPHNHTEVNHIDGDKLNNHYTNLEWCSRKENQQHAVRLGLIRNPKGGNHPSATMSEKVAREIKFSMGSNKEVSAKYGVHTSTVNSIRKGRSWKHLKEDRL